MQKLFCTGHVNCENTERLHVRSVILIKYSPHVTTYIRNLPFSFELVFLIIIAYIQTRSTPNACYIKIYKETKRTNACYISLNHIWYSRLCSKTKRTVYEIVPFTFHLYIQASVCQRRICCFGYGRSFSSLAHKISVPRLVVVYSDPSYKFWYSIEIGHDYLSLLTFTIASYTVTPIPAAHKKLVIILCKTSIQESNKKRELLVTY